MFRFHEVKSSIEIVLPTGEHVIPFGENVLAIQMNNLWDCITTVLLRLKVE